MKFFIVFSIISIFISVGCCGYIVYAESLDTIELIFAENIGLLFFILCVAGVVFSVILSKSKNRAKIKKIFIAAVLSLTVLTAAYTSASVISVHDCCIPEKNYIEDTEYIQKFFPFKDISSISTWQELRNGMLEYTNYPGYTMITADSTEKSAYYTMVYVSSLNPIINLRCDMNIMNITGWAEDSFFVGGDYSCSEFTEDSVTVTVYHNDKKVLGFINKHNKNMYIMLENYKDSVISDEDFAALVYEQYQLADECAMSKMFREKPWYDIPYYIRFWLDSAQNGSEYFPNQYEEQKT